jgi:hypothetical protein
MNAEMMMFVGGVGAFVLTVYWVWSRALRERYASGWLLMAFVLLVCGMFPSLIMRIADAARLSYPSAVLFISLAAIYFFSFFVTVSLTRQYRRNVRVMQETAILKERVEELERLAAAGTPSQMTVGQSELESKKIG